MEESQLSIKKALCYNVINADHRQLLKLQDNSRAQTRRTVYVDSSMLLQYPRLGADSKDLRYQTLNPRHSPEVKYWRDITEHLLGRIIDKNNRFSSRKKKPSIGLQHFLAQTLNQQKFRIGLLKQHIEAIKSKSVVRGKAFSHQRQDLSWLNQQMQQHAKPLTALEKKEEESKQKLRAEMDRLLSQHKRLMQLKDLNVRNNKYMAEKIQYLDLSPRESSPPKQRKKPSLNNSFRPVKRRLPIPSNKASLLLEDFISSASFNKLEGQNQKLAQELKSLRSESMSVLSKDTFLIEVNGNVRREVASLTKIANYMTCLYLATKYSVNMSTVIRIPRMAAKVAGTSADLECNDKIALKDLVYGMMLPSGNDAAYALADYFGRLLYEHGEQYALRVLEEKKKRQKLAKEQVSQFGATVDLELDTKPYSSHRKNVAQFVKQMNELCQHLQLRDTCFANPHGLNNPNNYSSSSDIASLCFHAMANQDFRRVVGTKSYCIDVYNQSSRLKRKLVWTNTNKLLDIQGCLGIKTGVTSAAGPCMAACFSKAEFQAIIVILKTKSLSDRFHEVELLFNWAYDKFAQNTQTI